MAARAIFRRCPSPELLRRGRNTGNFIVRNSVCPTVNYFSLTFQVFWLIPLSSLRLQRTFISSMINVREHIFLKSNQLHTIRPTEEAEVFGETLKLPSNEPELSSDESESSPELSEVDEIISSEDGNENHACTSSTERLMPKFTEVDVELLPTVLLIGRPNVGKSALFNRLIRRREALVHNTPDGHMTRDIREGVAKLGDLRFKVLDSAGLETEAIAGTVLGRTAKLTKNVLGRSDLAIFIIDGRCGLHPLDMEVAKWIRKRAPQLPIVVAMNKAEGIHDDPTGNLNACLGEAYSLGFGDPIPISAETGEGLYELYESLHPHLENALLHTFQEEKRFSGDNSNEKAPLQLAIAGRPNVGKSTLLNTLLMEERVLTGPEPGLTRDSVRVEFEYDGRKVYLVDTAGWLERSKIEGRPSALSAMHTRKNIMRAHIVAIVLDGEEIAKTQRSMKHSEAALARMVLEEGRGLVIVVNKMDLLKGKAHSQIRDEMMIGVPEELQMILPQVTGIPVVFISALEGKGRSAVMRKIVEAYEKWCLRLSTAKLNRWLEKVMARHSWKDHVHGPKVKYLTQVKARPPTFVAFVRGSAELSATDLRFLTKGLKEDFDLGGIPLRILQRMVGRKNKESKSSYRKKHSNLSKGICSDKTADTEPS